MEDHSEKRAEPRIRVASLENIKLSLSLEGKIVPVDLVNVSKRGLGLVNVSGLAIEADSLQSGQIKIYDKSFDIEFKVVYARGKNIGCLITKVDAGFSETVSEYFKSELLALNLKPTPSEYGYPEGAEARYFEGQNNCYVLIIEKGETLLRYKISYYGNVFQGGESRDFSVGQIIYDTELDSYSHKDTIEMLKTLEEVDTDLKESTIKFVNALEVVADSVKAKIAQEIRNH